MRSLFLVRVFIFINCMMPGFSFASINSDQAMSIVTKVSKQKYKLSIWAGMHSWETADLNGDHHEDFVALIRESADKKSENSPTHIMLVHGKKSEKDFSLSKEPLIINLDSGVPADSEDSFTVASKKSNLSLFKIIGCSSESAIKMTEEASTSFYLCWKNKRYQFLRDPSDTP